MDLSTDISSVTVFRDGARITRSGTLTLEKGPHKIIVQGITEYAQEDSFRVKGKGPASLASIDVRRQSKVYTPSSDIEQLIKKKKKLENELQELSDEVELHREQLSGLQTSFQGFSEHFGMVFAAAEGNLEVMQEFSSESEKRTFEIYEKMMTLEEKHEKLVHEINVIQNEINRINAGHRTESYFDIEISLEVSEKSPVKLDIIYQTGGAGWTPTYDVDLLDTKAKIRRIAMVRNQSKEEWKQVNLVISTATAKPVEAIEPTPFWIYAYDPLEERKKREGRDRMMAKAAPAPRMAAPGGGAPPPAPEPEPEIIEEYAEVSESVSGISIYDLPSPVDIPYDNEQHPVTLIEEEFDSRTIHYWYADGMAEVVAQDVVTNGDTVLMPGKVKVYAEGDYIGETSIDLISPREEFKLGTRIAYDIKAEKKMLGREVDKAGITRGKIRRSYKYQLKISNYSKKDIEIEIYDRIPYSLNPSIEIKYDFEKIGMKTFELGILYWESKIPAAGELKQSYEYEAQWERGVQINPPLP